MWNQLFRKIIISISTVVVFFALILSMLFITFFSPDNFKYQIVHQVYLKTGQTMEINGPIDWSFTPDLGIRLHQVKWVGASVVAEKVDAIVAWRPLFSGQVIIKKIMVHNLTLPFEGIQLKGDIAVDLKAQTLVADNLFLDCGLTLSFTHVYANLFADQQILKLSQLRGRVNGGEFSGQITANLMGDLPHFAIDAVLTKVKLEQFSHSKLLQGAANIAMNVNMQGNTASALMHSLNGKVQMAANDGAISNNELMKQVKNLSQWIKISTSTPFSQFTMSGVIVDGLLKSDDLEMLAEDFALTGRGKMDLPTSQMDYHMTMHGHAKMFNQKINFSVPFAIGGTFSKPSFKPDLSSTSQSEDASNKKLNHFFNKTIKNFLSAQEN